MAAGVGRFSREGPLQTREMSEPVDLRWNQWPHVLATYAALCL
jgi:hypothetical protein